MTRIHAVDHVQLPVPVGGLARARAFYEGALGLREVRHPTLDQPGTLRFALGPQRLDLSEGLGPRAAPQAHLALRLQGVRALSLALKTRGVPVDGPSEGPPLRAYVEDPFGNRLELIDDDPKELLHGAGLHFAV